MAVAWLSYVPVPGLQWVAVRIAPADPLTRYHAKQAGLMVAVLYVWVFTIGLLTGLDDSPAYLATMGLLAGVPAAAILISLVVGLVGAARRRYARIRPFWDFLALVTR